jgi:hypothetical protein
MSVPFIRNFATGWRCAAVVAAVLAAAHPAKADLTVLGNNNLSGTVTFISSTKVTNSIPVNGPAPLDLYLKPTDSSFGPVTFCAVEYKTAGGHYTTNIRAKGGDKVVTPNPDLDQYVTPTAEDAFAVMDLSNAVFGSQIEFSGDWTNSDAGVAQSVEWYDVTDPNDPVLLLQSLYIGGGSGSIDETFSLPGGSISNLAVRVDADVTSVPEPSTVYLVVIGLASAAGLYRRRVY